MTEKMTTSKLAARLADVGRECGPNAEADLRAHIAAVTAERDEAVRGCEAEGAIAGAAIRRADDAEAERDALRERVKALEAEKEAAQATLEDEQAAHAETLGRMTSAESSLAAIRQRAENWDGLLAAWNAAKDPENAAEGIRLVARYILGADAPAPSESTICVAPGCGDTKAAHHQLSGCSFRPPAELDGLQGGWCEPRAEGQTPPQTDDLRVVEQQRENEEAKAEPTTSEAFAVVRAAVDLLPDEYGAPYVTRSVDALSLLERRMGAMARALSQMLSVGCTNTREGIVARQEARTSLTDAPPVFTLEEVSAALGAVYSGTPLQMASLMDALGAHLTALRETSP